MSKTRSYLLLLIYMFTSVSFISLYIYISFQMLDQKTLENFSDMYP